MSEQQPLADRLKAKLRKPQPVTVATKPAPAPPAPTDSNVLVDVTAACGHVERFPASDKRLQEAPGRPCKACRTAVHEAKQKVEQEAAAQRKQAKKHKSGWKVAASANLTRLPHGACFHVTYDANRHQWSGTLTVPVEDGSLLTFTGEAGGLFRLNSELDRQHRRSLGLEIPSHFGQ